MSRIPDTDISRPVRYILDFRRFDRQARRRLYRGFVFAALVLILVAALWRPRLWERLAIHEEPYPTIMTDIVDIPVTPSKEPFRFQPPHGPRMMFRRETSGGRMPSKGIASRQSLFPEDSSTGPLSGLYSPPVLAPDIGSTQPFLPGPEGGSRISRQSARNLSMTDEMLTVADIESLYIFNGFIAPDRDDKQKTQGFVYVPVRIRDIPQGNGIDSCLVMFAEAVRTLTGITQRVDYLFLSLNSPKLFQYPILYFLSASDIAFTMKEPQIRQLGRYLRNGGFLIVENGTPWQEYTPAKASLLNILLQAGGKEARFDPIPFDHPIFHSYYDFDGPLPEGAEEWSPPDVPIEILRMNRWGNFLHDMKLEALRQRIMTAPDNLWGVWIGNRLVAVYSDRGYCHLWCSGMAGYTDRLARPVLELGINMVVFALAQPGGIAEQYADWNAETSGYHAHIR